PGRVGRAGHVGDGRGGRRQAGDGGELDVGGGGRRRGEQGGGGRQAGRQPWLPRGDGALRLLRPRVAEGPRRPDGPAGQDAERLREGRRRPVRAGQGEAAAEVPRRGGD